MNEFILKKDGVIFKARKDEDGDVYITCGIDGHGVEEVIVDATDAVLIGLALIQIGDSEK